MGHSPSFVLVPLYITIYAEKIAIIAYFIANPTFPCYDFNKNIDLCRRDFGEIK